MELKSYVCPNCGANTTNTQNCDYCGSLLVRFVEKGIDLSHTVYLNNDEVFPRLIAELKQNLRLQDDHKNEPIFTLLMWPTKDGGHDSIIVSQHATGDYSVQRGLEIAIPFNKYSNNFGHEDFNKSVDSQLTNFKQLDSFPLFTYEYGPLVDDCGNELIERMFKIDFGEDAEGAARLISEILIKVKGLAPTDEYDIFTNVSMEAVEAQRAWIAAHSNNSGCLGMIIAGLTVISASLALLF